MHPDPAAVTAELERLQKHENEILKQAEERLGPFRV